MKKISLILLLIAIFTITGCSKGETETTPEVVEETREDYSPAFVKGRSNLQPGHYYIEHDYANNNEDNYDEAIFYEMYWGEGTLKEMTGSPSNSKAMFFHEDFGKIPTMYATDRLVYCMDSGVLESFSFERYEDMGISIGLTSLYQLSSGRYALTLSEGENSPISLNSDASLLYEMGAGTFVFDKVGGMDLREPNVNRSGVITDLTPYERYVFDIYTGTYLATVIMQADTRILSSWGTLRCTDYEFLKSNIATLNIPEYFVDGYYRVNSSGLFRYCKSTDKWTEDVAMNEPVVVPQGDYTDNADENEGYEGFVSTQDAIERYGLDTVIGEDAAERVRQDYYSSIETKPGDEAPGDYNYDEYGWPMSINDLAAKAHPGATERLHAMTSEDENMKEYVITFRTNYEGNSLVSAPNVYAEYKVADHNALKSIEIKYDSTKGQFIVPIMPEYGECVISLMNFVGTTYTTEINSYKKGE